MTNYSSIAEGVYKRDMQSQMEFYDMFVGTVYQSAFSILGNADDAEEITQDTMLKVFNKSELINNDAKAMARILRRIATNASIDEVRRRKDFIFSFDDALVADVKDDEDENDCDFSVEEIKAGIALLPVAYRSILTLRLFDDVDFADIAKMFNLNCSTARVQYTRGIAKLKNWLIKKQKDNET